MYLPSWRGELPANYTLMIKNSNDNVTFINVKLVDIIYKAMHSWEDCTPQQSLLKGGSSAKERD